MIVLGLLAGLVVVVAGGFGATLLLMRGNPRLNLVECAALSWLFGTGLISLLLWGGGFLASGTALQVGVATLMIAIAAAGFLSARQQRAQLSLPKPRNRIDWVLAGAILLEILVMFYGAAGHGLGWDGLINWEVKARYAFLNGGVIPPAYYSSETRAFTHQAYPLAIPLTELWLYLSMGEAHQFWIKLIFPLFYVAGAALLASTAARLTNHRWPGLLTAALLFFVPFLTNSPGDATGGYVDVPLGMIYLATISYLIVFAADGEAWALRIYAASLVLLPWTKREGAILWLIAAACGALVIWRGQRTWRSFLWLLPGGVILAAWKMFIHLLHTTETREFVPMSLSVLHANVGRIGPISRMVVREMAEMQRWSLFWAGVAVAFVYLACRARDRRLLLLAVAVVAPIAAYAATYLFSNWPDYTLHFEASFSRLLLQVMPVAWLVIALAMPWQSKAAENSG